MKRDLNTATTSSPARQMGLRYTADSRPGIGRRRRGGGFSYLDADGKLVKDRETLRRIRALVIPPAWKNVWICPFANGHLQVTGRDARGRKQSRYHARWREARDETKYERMIDFGRALPKIRRHVDRDLGEHGLTRNKVLATVVRLLETTSIRVGNTEYARENKTFGLTTMRTRHVSVKGSTIKFTFDGKSGVHHAIDIEDRRLAKVIRRCQDIPGHEIFQYEDSEGHHTIDSADVNAYIREAAGSDFTAKDFRTWAGTVTACRLLRESEAFTSETEAKRGVVAAIKEVAVSLGNTPSVCRKCYVHPAVIDAYVSGDMTKLLMKQVRGDLRAGCKALQKDEAQLLHLLDQKLTR